MANTGFTQTKTKAKQHYLKAKRQRRKKRLKAGEAVHKAIVKGKIRVKQQIHSTHYVDVQSHADSFDESSQTEQDVQPMVPKTFGTAAGQDDLVHRPRKRRKLSSTSEGSMSSVLSISSSASLPSASRENVLSPLEHSKEPMLVSAGALPSFEIPDSGDITFTEDLALQGLDPSLLGAEIVDSTKTAPIDSLPLEFLSSKTRKRLKELGIAEFFAVQIALLPFLLPHPPNHRLSYTPYNPPQDACVSAPTGSGKTLAYVIPILESLSMRIVTRLRALVVLPTRDLVTQVRETFEALCKGRGLKIGSVTGQHSFAHEQSQLVGESTVFLKGGSSKVDIVICTPGRLIDHLKGTRNFTLQHLEFLVIDEADRLLTQSFQDWLAQVLDAVRSPALPPNVDPSGPLNTLPYPDAVSPVRQYYASWRTHLDSPRESSCQKLLFSATLTRDPAKIAGLELRNPKYFIISDKATQTKTEDGKHLVSGEAFTFPSTLNEHMLVCAAYLKPLMLFFLIHRRGVSNALVFTKSAESTNRLVGLFECFEKVLEDNANCPVVRAYSSDLGASERKVILGKFKAQEITILICSDLISRGIDISQVAHVVSYDVPVDMRKYVHRVGRTARAGRRGDAWSLVEEQEARYFKKMMADANHLDRITKMNIAERELKELKETYEAAMLAYNKNSKPGQA